MGIETRSRNGALRMRRLRVWAAVLASILLWFAPSAQAFSAAEVYREAASSVVLIFGFEDNGAGSSGTARCPWGS